MKFPLFFSSEETISYSLKKLISPSPEQPEKQIPTTIKSKITLFFIFLNTPFSFNIPKMLLFMIYSPRQY